jgi:ribosomal protein L12E/L44/L45/RPP1/RPP2
MDFQDMKELLDAAKVPQSGTTPMPAIKANPGETPENKQEQEEGEEDSNANINHEPEKVIE